jgi:hypothetical protein
MGELGAERIGYEHLVAAVPILRLYGEERLADRLLREAEIFCLTLAGWWTAPRFRDPSVIDCTRLATALLVSADALRQAEVPDHAALGDWCCTLAARLMAVLDEPAPARRQRLVLVSLDRPTRGALVLIPLPSRRAREQ